MKKTLFFWLLAAVLGLAACSSKGNLNGNDNGTIGKAYAKGPNCDVKWVQLWEDGPKFAEYNVGATSATDYGGYYTWGGNYENGDYILWEVDGDNAAIDGSRKLSGDTDTATKLWGKNWRMPTKAELDALLTNCTCTWGTFEGERGYIFTGKGDYSSNSLFLPAAGSCYYGTVYEQGDYGSYWSSTPDGSDYAYNLLFDSDLQTVGSCGRGGCAYSVRAVLNEEPPTTGTAKATINGCQIDIKCVHEVPPTTDTAKATINGCQVDVKCVQLWEGGPKFAEYNVGATSASGYGNYYSWGGSTDKSDSDYNNGTSTLSGNADTATKLWGKNWRLPTTAEFEALLTKCTCTWITFEGVEGRNYTGKGDYSNNSVFLPAARYCSYGYVYDRGDWGYYWSSTPGGGDYAYFLFFGSEYQYVSTFFRNYGCSVRAVLAEN